MGTNFSPRNNRATPLMRVLFLTSTTAGSGAPQHFILGTNFNTLKKRYVPRIWVSFLIPITNVKLRVYGY